MTISNLILTLFIFINFIFIINFTKIRFFHLNIDKPDKKRKFHSKPTPLAGGQLIVLNIFLYYLIYIFFENFLEKEFFFNEIESFNYFIIISLSIFLLGFIDDKIDLNANSKFLILLLMILFLLFFDKDIALNKLQFSFYNREFFLNEFAIFFTIFCFLVFINAFNMFDGINLQSSFYSLFIFFYILFFYSNSLFIKILIISLIAFSYLNLKNKSFLGDSGSLLISFIISYLFIKLYNYEYIKYADEIVLFMLIPGLDLTRLFIMRILKKKNPLTSDRNHLHHVLIKKNSLKKTLFLIFSLISLPLILKYLNINNINVILITIFVFSFLIWFYSKKI